MDNVRIERVYTMDQTNLKKYKNFLTNQNLEFEEPIDVLYAAFDDEKIVATGALSGQIIKMMSIDPTFRGTNLIGQLLSEIMNYAFQMGQDHLFIYTKPEYHDTFIHLGFYQICMTDHVALFENRPEGFNRYISEIRGKLENVSGSIGAVVMNCNPFTLGHQHLIEVASAEVDTLIVFVLSEDKSTFPSDVRMRLVRAGTAHLNNVVVCETGPYMVSAATFPSYFLNEGHAKVQVQTELDAKLFGQKISKKLGITKRFLGEEPFSPTTEVYNNSLQETLKQFDVDVKIIQRKSINTEVISASKVRNYIAQDKEELAYLLVPESTREFLMSDAASSIIDKLKSEAHLIKRV